MGKSVDFAVKECYAQSGLKFYTETIYTLLVTQIINVVLESRPTLRSLLTSPLSGGALSSTTVQFFKALKKRRALT